MRKVLILATAGGLMLAAGLAWAQKPRVNPRRPIQATSLVTRQEDSVVPMATTVSNVSATPATIQFAANSPGSSVPGNSTATVAWTSSGGTSGNTWTLSVYANSTSFTGCTTVKPSAVKVSCTSASKTGTQTTANCQSGGPFSLPATGPGQEVAYGNEGGSGTKTYSIVLTYQFADSWTFIPNTCPLTITYTVNAP